KRRAPGGAELALRRVPAAVLGARYPVGRLLGHDVAGIRVGAGGPTPALRPHDGSVGLARGQYHQPPDARLWRGRAEAEDVDTARPAGPRTSPVDGGQRPSLARVH